MAKTKDADDTWERKRLATRWTRGAHTWLGEELTLRRKTWVVLDKVKHVLTIGASNPTCRHWLTPEKAKHVSTHVCTSSCFIQYHEKLEKPRRPSAGERMNELLGKGRRLRNRKEPVTHTTTGWDLQDPRWGKEAGHTGDLGGDPPDQNKLRWWRTDPRVIGLVGERRVSLPRNTQGVLGATPPCCILR